MRFANDFHSWLRHSWKLLANRLTRDPKIVISSPVKIIGKSHHEWPKIVIHGNSYIILYINNNTDDLNGNEVWQQMSMKYI